MYHDITDAVCLDTDEVSATALGNGYFNNTWQQGDIITLSVEEVSASLVSPVFVWEFWDGSVETTEVPVVDKVLNRAGQCIWTCVIVDQDGQSEYVTDSVDVHAPPTINSVAISQNGEAVPFVTDITVYPLSPYSLPLTYHWTVDGVAQGATTQTLRLTVIAAGTYTVQCTADDDYGGTDTVTAIIFGVPNQNPQVSPIGQSPVILRNGLGQTATFFVTAIEPEGQTMTFAWYRDLVPLSHVETTEGAEIKSTATMDLSVVTPAEYEISCVVMDDRGGSTTVLLPITVIANPPPVITSVTRTPSSVAAGNPISFTATAIDPDLDLLYYSWVFDACSPLPSITLTGAAVLYSTVSGQAGQTLTGTLVVTDSLGSSVSQAMPTTSIT